MQKASFDQASPLLQMFNGLTSAQLETLRRTQILSTVITAAFLERLGSVDLTKLSDVLGLPHVTYHEIGGVHVPKDDNCRDLLQKGRYDEFDPDLARLDVAITEGYYANPGAISFDYALNTTQAKRCIKRLPRKEAGRTGLLLLVGALFHDKGTQPEGLLVCLHRLKYFRNTDVLVLIKDGPTRKAKMLPFSTTWPAGTHFLVRCT